MKLALTFAILIATIGGCAIVPYDRGYRSDTYYNRDYRGDGYYRGDGNRDYYRGDGYYRGDRNYRRNGLEEHNGPPRAQSHGDTGKTAAGPDVNCRARCVRRNRQAIQKMGYEILRR